MQRELLALKAALTDRPAMTCFIQVLSMDLLVLLFTPPLTISPICVGRKPGRCKLYLDGSATFALAYTHVKKNSCRDCSR